MVVRKRVFERFPRLVKITYNHSADGRKMNAFSGIEYLGFSRSLKACLNLSIKDDKLA